MYVVKKYLYFSPDSFEKYLENKSLRKIYFQQYFECTREDTNLYLEDVKCYLVLCKILDIFSCNSSMRRLIVVIFGRNISRNM